MCKVTYVAMMHIFIISMVSAAENEVRSARMPTRTIKVPKLITYVSSEDPRAPLFQAQVASRNTPVSGADTDIEDNFSDAGKSTRESSFTEPLTDQQQKEHSFVSESSEQDTGSCYINFAAVQPIVPLLPTDKTMTSATKVAAELMVLKTKKKPCCCTCVIL